MKIELLNDCKLKITFTCLELSENQISLHSFLSDNSLSNRFIDELLNIAKEKLNFNIQNKPLKTEIYFLNHTHFAIYITINNQNYFKNKDSTNNSTYSLTTEYAFIFSSQDDCINFIKRNKLYLNNKNINIHTYQFKMIYFLLIDTKNIPLEQTKKMHISFFDESAPYFTSNILISKIREFSDPTTINKYL